MNDYFYFFIELSTVEKLKDDVERVLRFKDLAQLHVVWVVEATNDFYLFDEALLAILFTVGSLLRKCFHRVLKAVLESFYHIDCGEVASSDFFHGFELFVETHLIKVLL